MQDEKGNCTAANTAIFEAGSYCIFAGAMGPTQIFDQSCPPSMSYNWVVLDNIGFNTPGTDVNGTGAPAGEYYAATSVLYTCCRADGPVDRPISLPNKAPFVLMPTATDRKCQAVKGMKVEYLDFFYDTGNLNFIPMLPNLVAVYNDYVTPTPRAWGPGMHFKICSYTPL